MTYSMWIKLTLKLTFQVLFSSFVSCFLSNELYGIASTSLFNFVNWNFNMTMAAQSALHCFGICASVQSCSGVFFHPSQMVCVLCNNTYSDTSQLVSYSGMEYYRIRAKTCMDAVSLGHTDSGVRQIDPDGTAGFEPVTVWCDLTTEPGKAITILNHDHEARTFVEGYETCGSYTINLNYSVGLVMAKLVADLSTECIQQIRYECHASVIITVATGLPCARWRDRNGDISSYFTEGVEKKNYGNKGYFNTCPATCANYPSNFCPFLGNGSYPKYCDCSQTSCQHTSGCTCNINDQQWREDRGNVTNKEHLPITELQLGDTGGYSTVREMGYHTIGPLLCW